MSKKKMTRRDFVISTAVAGATAAAKPATSFGAAPTMLTQSSVKPLVIASGNGNRYKNGGSQTCVERAFELMTGGKDVLESLIEGVNIVELDPEDAGVGYGGKPNADGVVQLDSCCMHGPSKRAGGVAALGSAVYSHRRAHRLRHARRSGEMSRRRHGRVSRQTRGGRRAAPGGRRTL